MRCHYDLNKDDFCISKEFLGDQIVQCPKIFHKKGDCDPSASVIGAIVNYKMISIAILSNLLMRFWFNLKF